MADKYQDETRGLALANLTLTLSLIIKLQGQGILADTALADLLENALSTLEHKAPDNAGFRSARLAVEEIAASLGRRPPLSQG